MSQRPRDIDERLAILQAPAFGTTRSLTPSDPLEATPMVVAIDRIKAYDRNPRTAQNAAYEQIKASIKHRGYRGALPITRRPGEDVYMVAEGGNTALQIVKDLFEETQDLQYAHIHCIFEPWINESETLIAHLVENDSRGELIFIDRARAVGELRTLYESDAPTRLSYRELATRLKARGYPLDPAALSRMDYAIETLYPGGTRGIAGGLGANANREVQALGDPTGDLLDLQATKPGGHRQRETMVSGLSLTLRHPRVTVQL
jgi:ParB family protein of integrating conjugative element (PFGI_1 class)